MHVHTNDGPKEVVSGDLLYGTRAIAEFLGMTMKQCEHRIQEGRIPTFRIGQTHCSRRSTMARWLDAQEAGASDADAE